MKKPGTRVIRVDGEFWQAIQNIRTEVQKSSPKYVSIPKLTKKLKIGLRI